MKSKMKERNRKRILCGLMSGILLLGNLGPSFGTMVQAEEYFAVETERAEEGQEENAAETAPAVLEAKEEELPPAAPEVKEEMPPAAPEVKEEETAPAAPEAKEEETAPAVPETKEEETEPESQEHGEEETVSAATEEQTEVILELEGTVPEKETETLEESETIPEIFPFLDSDDAYVTKFQIKKMQPVFGSLEDGTSILEQVFYELEYEIDTVSGASYETAELQLELLLPLTKEEAFWDTETMSQWMEPGWNVELQERTFDFDQDGTDETVECQVLQGSCKVGNLLETKKKVSMIPDTGNFQVVLRVGSAEKETRIRPVFTVWMPYNQSANQRLGAEDLSEGPTENKEVCQVHGRIEQKTAAAESVWITPSEEESETEMDTETVEETETDTEVIEETESESGMEYRLAVREASVPVDFEVQTEKTVAPGSLLKDAVSLVRVRYDNGSFSSNGVTVTSPGWPNNIPCKLTEAMTAQEISFPGAEKIKITFDPSSFVGYGGNGITGYDREGNVILEKVRGYFPDGKTYEINGDYIKLTFQSDNASESKGFLAVLEPEPVQECTETVSLQPEYADLEAGEMTVEVCLDGSDLKKEVTLLVAEKQNEWKIGTPKAEDVTAVLDWDGTLRIFGTGAAAKFPSSDVMVLADRVKKVIVEEGVTELKDSIFSGFGSMTEAELPKTLTKVGNYAFEYCTSLEKIQFSEGLEAIGSYAFGRCKSLKTLMLPQSTNTVEGGAFYYSALEEIQIPGRALKPYHFWYLSGGKFYRAVLTGGGISSDAFGNTILREVVLDGDCGETGANAFITSEESCPLQVTVTAQTHEISETFWTEAAKRGLGTLTFQGENTIKLRGISKCGLSAYANLKDGTYYVDGEGNLWYLDGEGENTEASLALIASAKETVTIPDTINGYPVTGVGTGAFANCPQLSSVTFLRPEAVTHIDTGAFYGREKLTQINGENEVEKINALFAEGAEIGWHAYEKTGLTQSEPEFQITAEALHYRDRQGDGPEMTISTEIRDTARTQEDEVFRVYTGEYVSTTIALSNTSAVENDRVVVYLQMDHAQGSINHPVGDYILTDEKSGNRYQLKITKDSNKRYRLEFEAPKPGDTVVFNLSSGYPSPSSAGGEVLIWGAVLTPEERDADFPQTVQKASWETKADDWLLTKKPSHSPAEVYSEEAFGTTAYVKQLYFSYDLTRTGTTLEGVGKDHMEYVQFTDILTLQENFSWNPEIVAAVNRGDVFFDGGETTNIDLSFEGDQSQYLRGKFYCTINGKNYLIADLSGSFIATQLDNEYWNVEFLEENGEQKLLISWRIHNGNPGNEIGDLKSGYVNYGSRLIQCDVMEIEPGRYKFSNAIQADQKFHYSENQQDQADAVGEAVVLGAHLTLSKNYDHKAFTLGRKGTFTLRVKNDRIYPYTTYQKLTDDLPQSFFIEAEKMEEMFAEGTFGREALTITINHAALYRNLDLSKSSVTASDGETAFLKQNEQISASAQSDWNLSRYETPTAQDPNLLDSNAAIVLTLDPQGNIAVSVTRGTGTVQAYTVGIDGTLQEIFDSIGYMPTYDARYNVVWEHKEPLILYGQQKLEYQIPATVKSTFMMLKEDTPSRYEVSQYTVRNSGYIYGTDGKQIDADGAGNFNYAEFILEASVSCQGKNITEKDNIPDNSVLDQTITIKHPANYALGEETSYEALPLTKLLTGSQVLMAEKAANSQLAEAGLPVIHADGVDYYLFNQAGEYKNVSIGGSIADTVKVENSADGMRTLLRWYEPVKPTSNMSEVRTFKTYLSRQESGNPSAYYEVGGMTWLGDHEGHRLYQTDAKLNGSVIRMEKKIVTNPEETQNPQTDQLADFSFVHQAEAVTYRIHFSSYAGGEEGAQVPTSVTMQGADLQDRLPKSMSGYRWVKDQTVRELKFLNAQGTQDGISFGASGEESWTISMEDRTGILYGEEENQQFIRWPDDFSVTFEGDLYLYVTLQFPESDLWSSYLELYGAEDLENKFFLRTMEDTVTHQLAETTEGYLNKGVLAGGLSSQSSRMFNILTEETSRKYYALNDYKERVLTFYATVYNPGNTRLYLNTICDVFPKECSYMGVCKIPDPTPKYPGLSMSLAYYASDMEKTVTLTDAEQTKVNWKTCRIDSKNIGSYENLNRVEFQVSAPGFSADNEISYDSIREQYYLKPGEGIAFAYALKTKYYSSSEDFPKIYKNALMMELEDYTGSGAQLGDLGKEGGVVCDYLPQCETNDGTCSLKTGSKIESDYGISSGVDAQWMYSEVELQRGEILPGITVKPVEAISADGSTVRTKFDAVEPKEKVKWDVNIVNDGSEGMRDYTVTDVMPGPYEFAGDVAYTINGPNGAAWVTGTLFTIEEQNEETAVLRLPDGSRVTVPLDGSETTIETRVKECSTNGLMKISVKVSMKKDEAGNSVLSLGFPDKEMGIPEQGNAVLQVITENPTNVMENKIYYNHAYVTPKQQEFNHEQVPAGNHTVYETKDSVTNSSLLTVAFGYTSSASKKVKELRADGTVSDTAGSGETPNYIVLQDPQNSLLRYSYEVENTTKKPLTKLVIIDHLPEIGDTGIFPGAPARHSQFCVEFAADPEIEVAVWNKERTEKTVLLPEQYRIDYTEKAEDYTDADWDCEDTSDTVWTAAPTEKSRAMRVVLLDEEETGSLIPVDALVEICFNAKVAMDQFSEECTIEDAAGWKAFNSFGYRYRRQGDSYELEAAPDVVGVQLPCIPKLQKMTTDRLGSEIPTAEDKTFSFLVHEGEALNDYSDSGMVSETLQKRGSRIALVKATVAAGTSRSEAIVLNTKNLQLAVYETEKKQWEPISGLWTWEEGKRYTIVEPELPYDYTEAAFNGGKGNHVTFTYSSAENRTYICKNTIRYGKIELTKYGSDGKTPLAGAEFILKSEDGTEIRQTSGSDGRLLFEQLPGGRYTITEMKTAEGHQLLAEPITVKIPLAMTEAEILEREKTTGKPIDRTKAQLDSETQTYYFYEFGYKVTNAEQLDLPTTGGNSYLLYAGLTAGLLLLTVMLIFMDKRRKSGFV